MKTNVGALLFGAAILSLFVPKRRRKARVEPAPAREARRLYALVQTRPRVVVLAVSANLEELEREVVELNETWNHWALRVERRCFEIQTAPVLASTRAPAAARSRAVASRG